MEDRTIMAVLYELYCDGELAGKINREGRVPELCCDKALAAIHARLKEKITELRKPTFVCECDGDKQDHCSCGARDREIEARKIDQVLKVLEGELTNGK